MLPAVKNRIVKLVLRRALHSKFVHAIASRSSQNSETGRIQFRGVRFQTPNSVSFWALTELRGENSVSSSRPIICGQNKLTEFFAELTKSVAELSEFPLPKQYSRNGIPPVFSQICYSIDAAMRRCPKHFSQAYYKQDLYSLGRMST